MNRICQFWVKMEKMMLLGHLLKQKARLLKILTTYMMLTNPSFFRQLETTGNISQIKCYVTILINEKSIKLLSQQIQYFKLEKLEQKPRKQLKFSNDFSELPRWYIGLFLSQVGCIYFNIYTCNTRKFLKDSVCYIMLRDLAADIKKRNNLFFTIFTLLLK